MKQGNQVVSGRVGTGLAPDAITYGEAERKLIELESTIEQNSATIKELQERLRPILSPSIPSQTSEPKTEGPPISPIANRLRNADEELMQQGFILTDLLHRMEF